MEHLERFSNYELSVMLDELKRDIRKEWETFKMSTHCLSDREMKDNALDAMLLYLIKKGFSIDGVKTLKTNEDI